MLVLTLSATEAIEIEVPRDAKPGERIVILLNTRRRGTHVSLAIKARRSYSITRRAIKPDENRTAEGGGA